MGGQDGQGKTSHLTSEQQQETLESLRKTRQRLRTVRVESGDPDIPATTRPFLTELKHGLRDLTLSTLNEPTFTWRRKDEKFQG